MVWPRFRPDRELPELPASLTDSVDVVVAGSGPAGTAAAIQLASSGYSVLVLERVRHPRFRIGESLPPKVYPLLAILGVAEAVQRAGFATMGGTTIGNGDGLTTHDFHPDGTRRGWQVQRGDFDRILVDRARMVGCVVAEETALIEAGPGWVEHSSGRTHCRFVVDATGTRAVLGRQLGLRVQDELRTVALCAYWRDCEVPDQFEPTNTVFEMLEDGWIWSVLRSDGLRNVTIGLDAAAMKGVSVAYGYEAALARSTIVGPLLAPAERDGDILSIDATWSWSSKYAGDWFVLCGDAACFVDPLTSQGVYKALQSGVVAAAVINTVLSTPEDAAMALEFHESSQREFATNYGAIAATMYRESPYATAPFWAARARGIEADDSAEASVRRTRFIEAVREAGGMQLELRAQSALTIQSRSEAASGRVVKRDRFVFGDRVIKDDGVDVPVLLALLDGRNMASVFDGYAASTGEPASNTLGRRLINTLASLAEWQAIQAIAR